MKDLTKRQETVLKEVINHIEAEQRPPSLRELGKLIDVSSLRGVQVHLEALAKKGYVEIIPYAGIKLLKDCMGTPIRVEVVASHG